MTYRVSRIVSFWFQLNLATGVAFAQATEMGSVTRGPYLQTATPNSIRVAWRTEGSISPIVRFGESVDRLTEATAEGTVVVRASIGSTSQALPTRWRGLGTATNLALPKLHSAPLGTFQYEARLQELKPRTRYYYALYDNERRLTPVSNDLSFLTPPPMGDRGPVRFWVVGDSGTGRSPQYDVLQAATEFARRSGRAFDFWIHVGDMAYGTGRDNEFQTRFFKPYRPLLQSTVCWPTMGNHEGFTAKGTTGIGPYYDAYVVPTRGEAGGLASGTEAYYSFNYANVHFVCLDSHDLDRKPTGAMAKWFKADLEKAKSEWIIAFWHHPPYTKGSHDSDKEKDLIEMRQHIMPIAEAGGVDLVLTGHSHIYERSMLMDGAYGATMTSANTILDDGDGDPDGDGPYLKSEGLQPHQGTVHVVTGNGGQELGRSGSAPVMKKVFVEFGSVIVDVNGDTLTTTMVNRVGKTRDLFNIVKRGVVEPVRLPLPWQLPEYKKPAIDPKEIPAPSITHRVLIPKGSDWTYLTGNHPRGQNWTRLGFNGSGWKTGAGSFGLSDGEFKTTLEPLRRKGGSLYVRKEFQIDQADKTTELGLLVDYRDSIVVYLNGWEVVRLGVGRSTGRNAQDIKTRESQGSVYIPLRDGHKYARDGTNVLAIEVHSASAENLDLFLDPSLVIED